MRHDIQPDQLRQFRQQLESLSATLQMVANLKGWFPEAAAALHANDSARLDELSTRLSQFTNRSYNVFDYAQGERPYAKEMDELERETGNLERNLTEMLTSADQRADVKGHHEDDVPTAASNPAKKVAKPSSPKAANKKRRPS